MISLNQRERTRQELQDSLEVELDGLRRELKHYQTALDEVPMEDEITAAKYQTVLEDTEYEIATIERKLFEVRNYSTEDMDLVFSEQDRIQED